MNQAAYTCDNCHGYFCYWCVWEIEGHIYCKECMVRESWLPTPPVEYKTDGEVFNEELAKAAGGCCSPILIVVVLVFVGVPLGIYYVLLGTL